MLINKRLEFPSWKFQPLISFKQADFAILQYFAHYECFILQYEKNVHYFISSSISIRYLPLLQATTCSIEIHCSANFFA